VSPESWQNLSLKALVTAIAHPEEQSPWLIGDLSQLGYSVFQL